MIFVSESIASRVVVIDFHSQLAGDGLAQLDQATKSTVFIVLETAHFEFMSAFIGYSNEDSDREAALSARSRIAVATFKQDAN